MTIQPNPGATEWPSEYQGSRFTGKWQAFDGSPMTGTVTFTPAVAAVIAGASKVIIVGTTLTFPLDANGSIDVILPATDDPDTNPTGWTYAVVENFSGGRKYSVDAPMNATRDLSAIVPVPSSAGSAIVRGQSAYEHAVDGGYVGTEAEFEADLAAAANNTVADATAASKGVVQLAGDLGGTAAAPTVPGLADKVDVADAVSLSTDTPAASTPTGHPGTDNTAARGDHEHPAQPTLVTGIPILGRFGIARTSTTVWTPTLSRIYLQPYPVFTMNRAGLTVSAVYTYVQNAGSADSTCKVALYRPGSDGMPDFTQMVIPETTIATAASTGERTQALASNVALPDGWYWRAVLVNGTTSPGFKSTARSAPLPQMRNESVSDQYSVTKFINASRTSLPTTNGDSFIYESTDDIAPLVLGVV